MQYTKLGNSDLNVSRIYTAIAYQSGSCEQYAGRALRDFAKRDELIAATKFLPRTQDDIAAGITGQSRIQLMTENDQLT